MAGRFGLSNTWFSLAAGLIFLCCFGCAASPDTASCFGSCSTGGPAPAGGGCFTGPAPFYLVDAPNAPLPLALGSAAPGSDEEGGKAMSDNEDEGDEEEQSVTGKILLYIPNRICDAVEIVRAGVNVGFGIGADLRATWAAKAIFINDMSVGVGFQGFRHLPICMRAHSQVGVGPIKTPNLSLLDWPVNDYDIRVELFAALVGAHVAVDLEALLDFVTGIFCYDLSDDDFILG